MGVAENKSKNWKLDSENLKTNWMLNKSEPPTASSLPENWNERSRKSLTKPKKTRRTWSESKIWLTNCRLRSRPTSDNLKKLKKLPTPTCLNTESFNTNWMKRKNELIWLNLLLTRCEPRPETPSNLIDSVFKNIYFIIDSLK